MWRTKRILHRDVSLNNILLRKKSVTVVTDDSKVDVEDMCFSAHLLAKKSQLPSTRLDTRVLLIDFDMAAFLPREGEIIKGEAMERTVCKSSYHSQCLLIRCCLGHPSLYGAHSTQKETPQQAICL